MIAIKSQRVSSPHYTQRWPCPKTSSIEERSSLLSPEIAFELSILLISFHRSRAQRMWQKEENNTMKHFSWESMWKKGQKNARVIFGRFIWSFLSSQPARNVSKIENWYLQPLFTSKWCNEFEKRKKQVEMKKKNRKWILQKKESTWWASQLPQALEHRQIINFRRLTCSIVIPNLTAD